MTVVANAVIRGGLRRIAVPDRENGAMVTDNVGAARDAIARAGFFGRAFALDETDQEELHREAAARLREEAAACADEPVGEPPS